MPKIFRRRDIDQMLPSDVSQDFVDYYYRMSDDRRKEFAERRPDLVAVVQKWESSHLEPESAEHPSIQESATESIAVEDDNLKETAESVDFSEIMHNAYDGINISKLIKDDFRPIEALTIEDRQIRCPAHRIPLIEYNPRFHNKHGAILGVKFYHCPECNRLFIKQSRYDINRQKLEEWEVPYTFYDFEISRRFLKTQTRPYVLKDEEKIYVPEQWVEENPTCPIHKCTFEELPCIIKFDGKEIAFDAYFCPECQKVAMRRTSALKVEDRCAEIGIPLVEFEKLAIKAPPKPAVPKREIRPDYLMDSGNRKQYAFEHIANCYKLTESDTVIVSDSVYCTIDGHDTETVLGLIWVREKVRGERKSYLFMLGYCAECQKYYMDENDYKAVYKIGRPEVSLLLDITDDSYMITSGEVFDLENKHLSSIESEIKKEATIIRNQPDYVSQYATMSGYDDGNLAYSKSVSKRKYEPRLTQLYEYSGQPYQYRVDIVAGGTTEVYYVGSQDIKLDGKVQVVSANSKFGRELIHYQTIKIAKDGEEYSIKLSRQFDIKDAALYGYANLRTDEDIIFRKGITDPFLVRVLNMRKRQHNLIDIFVTIQENQNTIVDADFKKSLIVQGCAGSGKTMVLLHRLSSLKYNHPEFDFSSDALILTPNDHFTLHIKGLAESLQIGSINRTSVEKYYASVLEKYSKEMKPAGAISSEMSVKQIFVDFIYSDEFRASFEKKYDETIIIRNQLITRVQNALTLMNENRKEVNTSDDSKVVPQLNGIISSLASKISSSEARISDAAKSLKDIQERKAALRDEIPKKRQFASTELRKSASRAKAKAIGALAKMRNSIEDKKRKIDLLIAEKGTIVLSITSADDSNASFSLDEYISSNKSWVDSSVEEFLVAISGKNADIDRLIDENQRLTALLAIPVENTLKSETSEDGELSAILFSLTEAREKTDKLLAEKRRIESNWIMFGRSRKLSEIDAQINESESVIETHKATVVELYSNRQRTFDSNLLEIEALRSDIAALTDKVKSQIVSKKKKRITEVERQISSFSENVQNDSATLEKCVGITYQINDEMSDSEICAWLKILSEFAPDVSNELKLNERLQAEIAQFETLYAEMDAKIATAQEKYDKALSSKYPVEVQELIEQLANTLSEYSDIGTFRMIFDATVAPFKEKHNIKNIVGRYHRYDLYAQLIFSRKFYGGNVSHVKFMCIDEGQDLALNEYRLIYELNSYSVIFNIFGDINQLIKANRGINNWEVLKSALHAEQFTLNENYRNTNQITRFCNDSFEMSMLQTGVDGVKVREITKKEFDTEVSAIQINSERIAVLLPRGVPKKKYIDMISATEDASGEEIVSGKIAVMYVDEVKGIEFDKVYVIPNNMGRNEKYIAYTRALSELIIVIDESVST